MYDIDGRHHHIGLSAHDGYALRVAVNLCRFADLPEPTRDEIAEAINCGDQA